MSFPLFLIHCGALINACLQHKNIICKMLPKIIVTNRHFSHSFFKNTILFHVAFCHCKISRSSQKKTTLLAMHVYINIEMMIPVHTNK